MAKTSFFFKNKHAYSGKNSKIKNIYSLFNSIKPRRHYIYIYMKSL